MDWGGTVFEQMYSLDIELNIRALSQVYLKTTAPRKYKPRCVMVSVVGTG